VLTEVERKITALGKIVGNTPLLGNHFERRGRQHVIYAKSEQVNMTGSIKDRMAPHIMKEAYATGEFDRAT
jgi:cysteine synthase A